MNNPQKKEQTLRSKLFSGGGWALFTMFVWELVEEGLENLIAMALSSAVALFITKALSTLAIITATQGIKVTIKRFLVPFIKELTYKEGDDKMKKLRQFFSWLNANKCTIGGIAIGALTAVSGAGLIDASTLPALIIGSVNVTPIIYYCLLGGMTILVSFFPETVDKFKARVEAQKQAKEVKLINKQAKKEIAEEEKLANQTQAQQEKAKAKAEAEALAREKKEETEKLKRAKIEEAKAKILAERENELINK